MIASCCCSERDMPSAVSSGTMVAYVGTLVLLSAAATQIFLALAANLNQQLQPRMLAVRDDSYSIKTRGASSVCVQFHATVGLI